MERQVVFDTETSGLKVSDGNRIIEIAGVEIVNRKITGKEIHFFVNPECDIEPEALAVHGITRGMLAGHPRFKDILPQFLEFIDGAELIAHNAPFDEEFTQNEMSIANHPKTLWEVARKVTDTMVIARRVHPGGRKNLDALAKHYGVSLEGREKHSAILDCHILAQVYLKMTEGLDLSAPDLETDIPRAPIKRIQRPPAGITVMTASEDEMIKHQLLLDSIQQECRVNPVERRIVARAAHP